MGFLKAIESGTGGKIFDSSFKQHFHDSGLEGLTGSIVNGVKDIIPAVGIVAIMGMGLNMMLGGSKKKK